MNKIPLSNPDITVKEINAVLGVLRTPDLSLGPKLSEFETKFAAYLGVKHAVAVNSGTSGLHLCIKALGIEDGDEVLTTPFSFVASANCMLFERARPIFVDVRDETFNLNEDKIEDKITAKTKAILPVHVFGYPCNMPAITRLAAKYKLAVIEDACESIGAEVKGKKVGTFGKCSVFAFYPNKQMTTGEGGMVATNDKRIALLAKSLRNQGRDDSLGWLAHNRLGYNYRLSELNCALGIAQLERLKELLAKREKVAQKYHNILGDVEELILPPLGGSAIKRTWFVYVVRLRAKFSRQQRDDLVKLLRADGIGCNVYFPAIHLQPFYQRQFGFRRGDFPIAEAISDRTIALPFFNRLDSVSIKRVASTLKKNIKKVKYHG